MTKKSIMFFKNPTVMIVTVLLGIIAVLAMTGFFARLPGGNRPEGIVVSGSFDADKLKPDTEWKKILTPAQYYILREAGTEVPFTGKLNQEKRKGTYYSVGCDEPAFRSEKKFDSGTGWPSFTEPIRSDALVLREDNSILGETRIEVLDKCGGHLGHVFNDGPSPTYKRYCMNSEALYFVPDPQ